MTNSCKVIRQPGCETGPVEVWTTRPGFDEEAGESFQALDSLWHQPGVEEAAAVRARLEREVAETEEKCRAMVAAAEDRVAAIEAEAREKGMAKGREEGRAAADAQLQEALARLEALMDALKRERGQLHERYRDDIVTLVKVMVDKVLFHEVATNPKVIEACLATALNYVVENSAVRVQLHPDDLARLREIMLVNPDAFGNAEQIELVENPALTPGGCRLESAFGDVDAGVETRRQRLFAAIDAVFAKALDTIDASAVPGAPEERPADAQEGQGE